MSSDSLQSKTLTSVDQVDAVVDADSHTTESIDELVEYVDDEKTKRALKQSSSPLNEIYSTSLAAPSSPFNSKRQQEYFAGDRGPEYKLKMMDEFGIDYAVLQPTLQSLLPSVNNPDYARELAHAYNSWLQDTMLGTTDRIKATCVVDHHQPARAAEEIDDRATEDGFVAVGMPATGLEPPPGHEWFDPIYQSAQDNELPVLFHSAGQTWQQFPVQDRWNETWAEDHAMSHSFSLQYNLITMITRGIPERFPDVEFVLSEAGIAWVPYMIWRLDDHYLEYSHEFPNLNRLPSEYIRDQFHFTTQPLGHTPDNPEYIAQTIKQVGAESVWFAADMPHQDFDTPEELFDRIAPYLEPDEVKKIMGGNAVDTLGL